MNDLTNHIAATIRRTEAAVVEPAALAEVIVDDLRAAAVLPHALHISFSETELMALRVLIETSSFRLSEADFAKRLHAAIGEALTETAR